MKIIEPSATLLPRQVARHCGGHIMKKFCLNCGEEILATNKRKFCTKYCADKWKNYHKPVTIANNFPLFKNIVAVSENPEEFNELYQKYFSDERRRDI